MVKSPSGSAFGSETDHVSSACSLCDLRSRIRLRRLLFTTVIVVVAVAAPAVAVIVALPGPTPVPRRLHRLLRLARLSEVQLIGTPVRGSPLKIRVTASSRTLPPTTSGFLSGLISIVLTLGAFTMKVVKPGLPPTIAPTVTSPVPKSFTLPSSSTAAMSNGPAKYVEGFSFIDVARGVRRDDGDLHLLTDFGFLRGGSDLNSFDGGS